MRLAEWRERVSRQTQQQLAAELGCSQPFISLIERAVDGQIPGPEWMVKIYQLTRGAVAPNDFYDLPPIGQLELTLEAPAPAPLFDAAADDEPQLQAAA